MKENILMLLFAAGMMVSMFGISCIEMGRVMEWLMASGFAVMAVSAKGIQILDARQKKERRRR